MLFCCFIECSVDVWLSRFISSLFRCITVSTFFCLPDSGHSSDTVQPPDTQPQPTANWNFFSLSRFPSCCRQTVQGFSYMSILNMYALVSILIQILKLFKLIFFLGLISIHPPWPSDHLPTECWDWQRWLMPTSPQRPHDRRNLVITLHLLKWLTCQQEVASSHFHFSL